MLKSSLLLLFLPITLLAQNIVKGRIISAADKSPITHATIFLSNSTIGSASLDDGSFELTDVKDGRYDLVVSCIGYNTYHQTISAFRGDVSLPDIVLEPKVSELHEVKIISINDATRKRYLKMFTDAFFGNTKNAAQCKLINPDLLSFDYDESTDRLSGTSDDFLILENRALGYRIKYMLLSFLLDPGQHIVYYTGPFVFEEMKGKKSEKKEWIESRKKAYLGSEMHFLRACIKDEVVEENFNVRRLVRTPIEGLPSDSVIYANIKRARSSPMASDLAYWINQSHRQRFTEILYKERIDSHDFIRVTNVNGIYAIGYPDCLVINYGKSGSFDLSDNTIITFKEQFSYFDSNGVIINPTSNIVEGYWGNHRIAELLPVDYELPK